MFSYITKYYKDKTHKLSWSASTAPKRNSKKEYPFKYNPKPSPTRFSDVHKERCTNASLSLFQNISNDSTCVTRDITLLPFFNTGRLYDGKLC